jgi:hypothetical protein
MRAQKKISKFILPLENLEEVGQFRARNNTCKHFCLPEIIPALAKKNV